MTGQIDRSFLCINTTMGAFGGFSNFEGFSKPQQQKLTDSQRPRVLGPTGQSVVDNNAFNEAKKKVGKPIDTYESRVKPIKYAGLILGGLYHIDYSNYQHDPSPLALILNKFDTVHGNFRAFNLHYIPLKAQMDIILRILYLNGGTIRAGKPLRIEYEMLKPLFKARANYTPFRYYKPYFIKNPKYVPVRQWVNHVKNSRTILP